MQKEWCWIPIIGLLSYCGIGIFRDYAIARELLDHPSSRSSHRAPTPRGGGLVFAGLWCVGLFLAAWFGFVPQHWVEIFLPACILISAIGYLDDHLNLPASWRLIMHVFAAIWVIYAFGGVDGLVIGFESEWHLGKLALVITLLTIVWSINLFNFMDGLDGLATTEALFIFGVGGCLLVAKGAEPLAWLAGLLCATLIGFLIWNRPCAKIFMGDVGSTFLGLLVPLFAIASEKWYQVSALIWMMMYSVFVVDASFTLIRRIKAKQAWYKPHRLHAFQRLHRMGWSHVQVLKGLILINSLLSILAMIAYAYPRSMLVCFLLGYAMVIAVYVAIERKSPMFLAE